LSPNLEEVKSVIDKMILYHSVLVSDIDNEPEFGDFFGAIKRSGIDNW